MDGEHNGKPYFLMDDLGGKPTIFGNIQPEFKPIWGSRVPYLFTTTRGLVTINCLTKLQLPHRKDPDRNGGSGASRGSSFPYLNRNASGKEAMHVGARRCRKRFLSRNKIPIRFKMNSNCPFWRDSLKVCLAVMSILHSIYRILNDQFEL